METTFTPSLFPPSPKDELTRLYVGKSIRDVPTPAAVMDVAAVRRNCARMLHACEALELGWRAHIKTHKTAELTKLQVGESPLRPANIIVSTLSEAEFILPTLQSYISQSRPVNVLYGLPISPAPIPRLAAVGKALGKDSISVLIDHPGQVSHLSLFGDVVPHTHIKVDMGGKRAGVVPRSEQMRAVVRAALQAHRGGEAILKGLYSHAGHSYGGDSRVAAMQMLRDELSALLQGAEEVATQSASAEGNGPPPRLTLSVGASPTALAVQNLLEQQGSVVAAEDKDVETRLRDAQADLTAIFSRVREAGHAIEIHAGVYPTLDLQQLAAHSLSSSLLSWHDIAFTVVAEVCSVYPGRGEGGETDEVLIGAGGLALGREFCKAYPGMALLTPWGREGQGVRMPESDVEDFEGWMVGRFAQEHGIVTWRGGGARDGKTAAGKDGGKNEAKPDVLEIGQKVRLWPNHACITGSHFGWYFVVDSDREGQEDNIVDVWVRTRGW